MSSLYEIKNSTSPTAKEVQGTFSVYGSKKKTRTIIQRSISIILLRLSYMRWCR